MGRSEFEAKVRLTGDSSGAERALNRTEKSFLGFASKLKYGALGLLSSLGGLAGSFKLIEDAGERLGQQRAFERALKAQGVAADEFLGKLEELANRQIATSDLILASNRALALGISASDLPGLLEAATKASVALGVSATQAFNDITTGVGRASPLILDNLGIVVDATKTYKDFADSIGVTVEQLTKQQKTAALSAAVMQNAAKGAEDFAKAQAGVVVEINRMIAAVKNWGEKNAEAVAESNGLLQFLRWVNDEMPDAVEGFWNFSGGIDQSREALAQYNREHAVTVRQSSDELSWLQKASKAFAGLTQLRERGVEILEQEAYNEELLNTILLRQLGIMGPLAKSYNELDKARVEAEARTAAIEAGLAKEASALSKLAAALGEVTQLELEREFNQISEALEEARNSTDASSDAFVRYEQIAVEKMERLQDRIQGLRDGLGDIGEATEESAKSMEKMGDAIDETAEAVDDFDAAVGGSVSSVQTLNAVLETNRRYLEQTAIAYDKLAKSIGEAAAQQAALESGAARLTMDGTRLRFGSTGSRLVNTTGRTYSGPGAYSLSPFGTGGNATVDADGSVRPE